MDLRSVRLDDEPKPIAQKGEFLFMKFPAVTSSTLYLTEEIILADPQRRRVCAAGTITGNRRILSHLKASEPLVAFQSHEAPLFGERIAPDRQVGHGHGRGPTARPRSSRGCRHQRSSLERTLENQYWIISSHRCSILSSGCVFVGALIGQTDNGFFFIFYGEFKHCYLYSGTAAAV